jgi:Tfp pilus assembly protein PilF
VDVGGNWLRFYRAGTSTEPRPAQESRESGLAAVLSAAARQGDARGNNQQALAVLDRGLARHPEAPPTQRVRALLYRVELLVRTGWPEPAARHDDL